LEGSIVTDVWYSSAGCNWTGILKLILGALHKKHKFLVPAELCMCSMLEENHGKC